MVADVLSTNTENTSFGQRELTSICCAGQTEDRGRPYDSGDQRETAAVNQNSQELSKRREA